MQHNNNNNNQPHPPRSPNDRTHYYGSCPTAEAALVYAQERGMSLLEMHERMQQTTHDAFLAQDVESLKRAQHVVEHLEDLIHSCN
jgi:hypothetical protein